MVRAQVQSEGRRKMGMTTVSLAVRKSHGARKGLKVTFLVDSGAVYSVVDTAILRSLGCRPYRSLDFPLADGSTMSRRVGDAYFEYRGEGGPAPVVFGEPGDQNLLGVTTLEALGLVLDPFKRQLRPMSMPLMGAVPFRQVVSRS
jgi:predicted aspartyl protease